MIADQPAVAFGEWLGERASRYATRPAIEIGGITRTYGDLDLASGRLGRGLTELGLGAGSRVAVMLGNCAEHIDTWFSLARIGAIEIPVNTAYTGELLRYLLAQCQAEVLVCDARHLGAVAGVADSLPLLTTIVLAGGADGGDTGRLPRTRVLSLSGLYLDGESGPAPGGPSSPGVILFSSGTTGPPKGILHTNGGCVRLGQYNAEVMGYGQDDVLWNCFPLFHQNARYTGVIPALDVGAKIVLESRFSASQFWETARAKHVTAFNYLGAVILMLWNQPAGPGDRQHDVRRAFGAGAPTEVWPRFEERFGVTLTEVYGLTEAPMATVNRRPGRLQSCGRSSDLFEVSVFDEADRRITNESVGEIVVRPKVPCAFMLGYDNDPGATVTAFRNLWFHTGDRGWMSPEGDLYFVDRAKDCIRRRGENISSWEIESVLSRHPGVLESAAYGVPSELSDEEVMVALVAKPGAVLDPVEVLAFCAGHLPAYAVPRYIRLMEALPHTPTERVQKYRLREAGVTPDTWRRGDEGRGAGSRGDEISRPRHSGGSR